MICWLFPRDPTVWSSTELLVMFAVSAAYLAWCLWRVGRVVVDLGTRPLATDARIREMEHLQDPDSKHLWSIQTDSRRRLVSSFDLEFRPPHDRTDPLPAGTAVRLQYRRATGRVQRIWTLAEPSR